MMKTYGKEEKKDRLGELLLDNLYSYFELCLTAGQKAEVVCVCCCFWGNVCGQLEGEEVTDVKAKGRERKEVNYESTLDIRVRTKSAAGEERCSVE
jgi:hypothetical protein